nr:hypothetical protein CFP56_14125 [Quercus suber]
MILIFLGLSTSNQQCEILRKAKIGQQFIKWRSFLLPTVFNNRCSSSYLMLLTSWKKALNIILNISLR